MAQWVMNPTRTHEDAGSIPGLPQGWGFDVAVSLWCRLQTQLGSGVAVAVVQAGSRSSDSPPSLGISISGRCGPKKPKE